MWTERYKGYFKPEMALAPYPYTGPPATTRHWQGKGGWQIRFHLFVLVLWNFVLCIVST